jgi:hypothetical protein
VSSPSSLQIETKNERKKRWLLLLKQKKRRTNTKEKNHREKKNAKKGRSLPFFSCFRIWDEVLFLLFPFHVPSTLSSPLSSSLVAHISLKLCPIQVWELSRALEMA